MTFYPQPKPLPKEPEPKAWKSTRPKTDPVLEAWKLHIKHLAGEVCEMAGLHHTCRGELDAHHVLGKGAYPHLIVDRDNGVALCRVAHDLVHRARWFKPYWSAWFNEKFPGRKARLEERARMKVGVGGGFSGEEAALSGQALFPSGGRASWSPDGAGVEGRIDAVAAPLAGEDVRPSHPDSDLHLQRTGSGNGGSASGEGEPTANRADRRAQRLVSSGVRRMPDAEGPPCRDEASPALLHKRTR